MSTKCSSRNGGFGAFVMKRYLTKSHSARTQKAPTIPVLATFMGFLDFSFLVGYIAVTGRDQVRGHYESQIASSRTQSGGPALVPWKYQFEPRSRYAIICKSFDNFQNNVFCSLITRVHCPAVGGSIESDGPERKVAKAGRNGCNPPFVSIGMKGTSTCTSTVIAEKSSLSCDSCAGSW